MNTYGKMFRVTTWGESHGAAVGAIVDGCPSGLTITTEYIQKELDVRRPGQSEVTTSRAESDIVEILSGVFEEQTLGTPISMLVRNEDIDSSTYESIRYVPRPGHADYTYFVKYGHRDHRGGGRSSARETVGRVAAGAIAKKLLEHFDIRVLGHVTEIHGIKSNYVFETPEDLQAAKMSIVRCCDPDTSAQMEECIKRAKMVGESVGGVAEVIAFNVPSGVGEPVFDKLDAELAKALMSIGAVKGVEIGAGFGAVKLTGSQMNDSFAINAGEVTMTSNSAGGILGGISTGQPIICRVAVKPTSSIAKPQKSVNLKTKEEVELMVGGRHDPCILPRVVPVAESMVAIVLADLMMRGGFIHPTKLE
jgi:chorismate synthase